MFWQFLTHRNLVTRNIKIMVVLLGIFENIDSQIQNVQFGHYRGQIFTERHGGQFPRTDLGSETESSPLPTPPGLLKLRLFEE